MKINALLILTNERIEIEVRTTEVFGSKMVAWLVGTDKVAELDLLRPETGWMIYPD